jgi:prevent-host-death family protein
MAQKVIIKASEGHRAFGKLLKRVYGSNEHLVVERDGFPVAVIISYQEYEKLVQQQIETTPPLSLPPVMSLEEAFGSVTPLHQPEDFATLRQVAIEEHVQKVVENMKD